MHLILVFVLNNYSYTDVNVDDSTQISAMINGKQGPVTYKSTQVRALSKPLLLFDPRTYFGDGCISSKYITSYNFFNQNDTQLIQDQTIQIKSSKDYIPDMYSEFIFLNGAKALSGDINSDDGFSRGFKGGFHFVYNPSGYLLSLSYDTLNDFAFTFSKEIKENINLGFGLSYTHDTIIGQVATDQHQSRLNIGLFGNWHNTFWATRYTKQEEERNGVYKPHKTHTVSLFQRDNLFDIGLEINDNDSHSFGLGYRNADNGVYGQLAYTTDTERLRGYINQDNVGIISPFFEFDVEFKNDFYIQRYNIGSSTYKTALENYNLGMASNKNIKLDENQINYLINY